MSESFEQWAILEIMGHNKFAGFVTEQVIGGASFVRVDVPECGDDHPQFTKLFGAASIYCITPVEERLARAMAVSLRQQPVHTYDLPQAWQEKLRQPLLASYESSDEGDDDPLVDDNGVAF